MSCMTILFPMLANHIRPQVKHAVNLVTADGHNNLQGLYGYARVNILTLSPLGGNMTSLKNKMSNVVM